MTLKTDLDNVHGNAVALAEFVNGDDQTTVAPPTGAPFSSIHKFLSDKDSEINTQADGILQQTVDVKNLAAQWASESEGVEVANGLFSALHYAAKAAQSAASNNPANIIHKEGTGLDNELLTYLLTLETAAAGLDAGKLGGIDSPFFQNTYKSVIDFASDANLTLTADQNKSGVLRITDTGTLLTAQRNVIVSNQPRRFYVYNDTAQNIFVKTAAGQGYGVYPGMYDILYCDGTDVLVDPSSPLGVNQRWIDVSLGRVKSVTYVNDRKKSIILSVYASSDGSTNARILVNGIEGCLSRNGFTGNLRTEVPSGSEYTLSIGTGSLYAWMELKNDITEVI